MRTAADPFGCVTQCAAVAAASQRVNLGMTFFDPAFRRALRAKAHHLHPVVTIGNHGLTPAVLHEIDLNLIAHELIKLRVFSDDRLEREALLARICDELDAAPVQHLGKVLVVYRARPDEQPDENAAPKRAWRPAKPDPRGRLRHPESGGASARRRTAAPSAKPRAEAKGGAKAPRGAVSGPPAMEGGRRGRAVAAPRVPKKTAADKAPARGRVTAEAAPAARRGRAPAAPAGPRPPQQRRRRG